MWCRLSCYSQVYTFEAKYVEDLRILSQVYLEPVEARLDIWRNEGPNSIQKQRKWNSLNQYSNALHALYEMHSNGLERNTEIAKQHHGRRNSSSGYAASTSTLPPTAGDETTRPQPSSPVTAVEWKALGNKHWLAGDLKRAAEAYHTAE